MPINDQQFETILARLEAGENMAAVQADFPALQEDIAALGDLQDFFAAQRLSAKPDPAGLKNVLRQIKALEENPEEDEASWGRWFTAWGRSFGVALPAVLILGVSGYMWREQLPQAPVEPLVFEAPMAARSAVVLSESVPEMALMAETEAVLTTASIEVASDMDMAALAQSLSAEFASELSEFETTRDELEPLYAEQLFSYQNTHPSAL